MERVSATYEVSRCVIAGRGLSRLPTIIRKFQDRNISFAIERGVEVFFTPFEFSIILGLPIKGQPVDINLKMKSRTMERLFLGKLQNLNQTK
ncbi:hypothetical protein CDL12_06028 [Handroanthus impetiginosus]|uniref:Uncharacterized protein n=1 Tax=Handroanthus impetiginosus TaxID=429701 RepID=A0A2G9HVC2_9LAMI|nr:hypothetical protein CDL12_06028 [Handroanthus impetiginosus]